MDARVFLGGVAFPLDQVLDVAIAVAAAAADLLNLEDVVAQVVVVVLAWARAVRGQW